jgi:hypothetical protein
MVEVTSASGRYCIDSTEVTNAHYAAFLAMSPTPSSGWPAPVDQGRHPVTFVDWCDAFAFCRWAGKRLCGKIGDGANAPADLANAAKSQWFNACTAGGTKAYPLPGPRRVVPEPDPAAWLRLRSEVLSQRDLRHGGLSGLPLLRSVRKEQSS